jgi:hypothetical protein
MLTTETAYDPVPSPDGRFAYVRTGWGRSGLAGMGRASLVSEVAVISSDGKVIGPKSFAEAFIAGWTPDGSDLICYRDWNYSLVTADGKTVSRGKLPAPDSNLGDGEVSLAKADPNERVAYLSGRKEFVWSEPDEGGGTLIETRGGTIARHDGRLGESVVPSPDERYLAVFGGPWDKHLWVYDIQFGRWSDLGEITIHPNEDEWDWYKAAWNPWFGDGSRLVYITGSNLIVSDPHGSSKVRIPITGEAGLPVPAPDGKRVAYVKFEPRPSKLRPDLKFWGGTTVWIQPLASKAKAFPANEKNSGTTYDLRWLGGDALVFDRLDDEFTPDHARVWKLLISSSIYGKTQ